ncbi:unnamed protein product [Acanthosepion pharaonis]|uniref:Uncharacterized protein n=1 Tax=Acanthosepion pharaonis TaxID=158019 RepID=A0A812E566_ACAPH|nr:unnamed protein product [Sepia pharaonis]
MLHSLNTQSQRKCLALSTPNYKLMPCSVNTLLQGQCFTLTTPDNWGNASLSQCLTRGTMGPSLNARTQGQKGRCFALSMPGHWGNASLSQCLATGAMLRSLNVWPLGQCFSLTTPDHWGNASDTLLSQRPDIEEMLQILCSRNIQLQKKCFALSMPSQKGRSFALSMPGHWGDASLSQCLATGAMLQILRSLNIQP